jgi:hypothetical protein
MAATLGPCEVIGQMSVDQLDLDECKLFEITTQHAPFTDFSTLGYAFDEADAKRFAASGELLEMLDNVTAALESCLAWFAISMTEADVAQRTNLAKLARQAVAKHRNPTCETCGAECTEHDVVSCPACQEG